MTLMNAEQFQNKRLKQKQKIVLRTKKGQENQHFHMNDGNKNITFDNFKSAPFNFFNIRFVVVAVAAASIFCL